MTYTKKEMVELIASTNDVTKAEAERAFTMVIGAVQDAIQKDDVDEVALCGLGKLIKKSREAKEARNPKTGESVVVPAHNSLAFKISTALKNAVR